MPRSRALARYPRQYGELLIAAHKVDGPEGVPITFDTVGKMMSFRSQFYAFLRAFERASDAERHALYPGMAASMAGGIFLQADGTTLRLKNQKWSSAALKIDETLAKLGLKQTQQPVEMPDMKGLIDRLSENTMFDLKD